MTGAAPSVHGITDNAWYKSGVAHPVGCVDDDDADSIGPVDAYDSIGFSPKRLMAQTLGDALKEQLGVQSRVWSISLKPTTAVISGGAKADGAIWFNTKAGAFMTSTYYTPSAWSWLTEMDADDSFGRWLHAKWDRVLPASRYAKFGPDEAPWEMGFKLLWLNTLPKILGPSMPEPNRVYYEQLQASPFGNELVFQMAREVIKQESLGKDEIPDLLILSLSSVDFCGHIFGPDSHEMVDMLARTDSQIGQWIDYLNETIGPDGYAMVLTSDHGVSPVPEKMQAAGLGGGRLDLQETLKAFHQAIADRFEDTRDGTYYVTAVDFPWVYLNRRILRYHKIDVNEAAHVVAAKAKQMQGISQAVVVADLAKKQTGSLSPLERGILDSTYPERSGEVYIHLDRYWYRTGAATGHGSFHNYDRHVPLMFFGSGFRKGVHDERIDMRDVAPTLSRVLGIKPPRQSTGSVLRSALSAP